MYEISIRKLSLPNRNRYLNSCTENAILIMPGGIFRTTAPWSRTAICALHLLRTEYTLDSEVDFVRQYKSLYPIRQLLNAIEIYHQVDETPIETIVAELVQVFNSSSYIVSGEIHGCSGNCRIPVIYDRRFVNVDTLENYYFFRMYEIHIYSRYEPVVSSDVITVSDSDLSNLSQDEFISRIRDVLCVSANKNVDVKIVHTDEDILTSVFAR